MNGPMLGCAHFKSIRRQARNSNYTLVKGQNEFIDFPILNSNNIRLNINVSDDGKLSKLTVSDMCSGGFRNILSQF